MMKWIFGIIFIASAISAIITDNSSAVTNALLEEGANAIELSIYLTGGICVWSGIMKIAEKSGISEWFAALFKPVGKLLFRGIDPNGSAFRAISMNISANLLGLGNAATPFGLYAMRELEREEGESKYASDNMVIFTVLNTASITLIPTTTAALRLKYGATNPMDILPAVLITSSCALFAALLCAKLIPVAAKAVKRRLL